MTNKQPLTLFPTTESNWWNENARTEGALLRDYFAAKCMSSIINTLNGPVVFKECKGDFDMYAKQAYVMADAMLKARG